MPTDINHDTIKAAVVTLLKADATIFTTTGEADEFKAITVGHPHGGDPLEDKMYPYCFVTNNNLLEENKLSGSVVSGNIKSITHTARYKIAFVFIGETPRVTEKKLDDMQQKIMEALEDDHQIGNTVHDSYPERVEVLNPNDTLGKTKQGRIITLRVKVTTGD